MNIISFIYIICLSHYSTIPSNNKYIIILIMTTFRKRKRTTGTPQGSKKYTPQESKNYTPQGSKKYTPMNINSSKVSISISPNKELSISPSLSKKDTAEKNSKKEIIGRRLSFTNNMIENSPVNSLVDSRLESSLNSPLNIASLSPKQKASLQASIINIAENNSSLRYENKSPMDLKKDQKVFEERVKKLFEKAFNNTIKDITDLNTFEETFSELYTLKVFEKINRIFVSLTASMSILSPNKSPTNEKLRFYTEFKKNFLSVFIIDFLKEYDLIKSNELINSLKSLKASITPINDSRVQTIKRKINSISQSLAERIISNASPARKKQKLSLTSHRLTYNDVQSLNSIYNSISELSKNKSIINNNLSMINLGSPKQDENILKNNGTAQLEQCFKVAFDKTLKKLFKPIYIKTISSIDIEPVIGANIKISNSNNLSLFSKYSYLASTIEFYQNDIFNDILETYVNNIYIPEDNKYFDKRNYLDDPTFFINSDLSLDRTSKKINSSRRDKIGGSDIDDFSYLLNYADSCHDWLDTRAKDIKPLIKGNNLDFIASFYDTDKLKKIATNENYKEYYNTIGKSSFELNFMTLYNYNSYSSLEQYKIYMKQAYRFSLGKKKGEESKIFSGKKQLTLKSDEIYKLAKIEANKIADNLKLHYDAVIANRGSKTNVLYIFDAPIANVNLSLTLKTLKENSSINEAKCFSKVWDSSAGDTIDSNGVIIDKLYEKNNSYNYDKLYESVLNLSKIKINKNKSATKNIRLMLNLKSPSSSTEFQREVLIKSGLGLGELASIALFTYKYLYFSKTNDKKVIIKEFNKMYNSEDKVINVYKYFTDFIDSIKYSKPNKDTITTEKKLIFDSIFRTLLDLKRSGDHGMVKTVEDLTINKKEAPVESFIISCDRLCITKAISTKVPCLFTGYDFRVLKENTEKKGFIEKFIAKVFGTNDTLLCFYKGLSIETPLHTFVVPILRYFTNIDMTIVENNKNDKTNLFFSKILGFIIKFSNEYLSSNNMNNIKLFNIDFSNKLNEDMHSKISNNTYFLFNETTLVYKYKLYIELIEILYSFENNSNSYKNSLATSIIAKQADIIELLNKSLNDVDIDIKKYKNLIETNKKEQENFNKQKINTGRRTSSRQSGNKSTALQQIIDSSEEKLKYAENKKRELLVSKEPATIFKTSKDKFINNTIFRIDLILKKIQTSEFICNTNNNTSPISNIITYIEKQKNNLNTNIGNYSEALNVLNNYTNSPIISL